MPCLKQIVLMEDATDLVVENATKHQIELLRFEDVEVLYFFTYNPTCINHSELESRSPHLAYRYTKNSI